MFAGFVEYLMAHMFIQFTPDIPIAKAGQENGEGFEFFPGTDDRIIRACDQKKGQIRVAHVPILFIERCFLQFEQVDKPVCCKNEAALRVFIVLYYILPVFRKPTIRNCISGVEARKCHCVQQLVGGLFPVERF